MVYSCSAYALFLCLRQSANTGGQNPLPRLPWFGQSLPEHADEAQQRIVRLSLAEPTTLCSRKDESVIVGNTLSQKVTPSRLAVATLCTARLH